MTARLARSRWSDSLMIAAALGVALAVGAMAVRSPQAAVTLTLLVFLLAVRLQSRTVGIILLWVFWLLTPLLRRVLDLVVVSSGPDPLSLLPFLGVAMLAILELRQDRLDRRARTIVAIVAAGFLIGIPAGFAADPAASSFAAFAYLAALSGFVLGWGDGVRSVESLHRVLAVALVPLSVYAICQYFLPLTPWDANWADTASIRSLGAPQEGHIRVFSTLNSPFTFAITLTTGILLGLGLKRSPRVMIALTLPVVVALALTFVRTAWLGLVLGIVLFAVFDRGRASARVVVTVAICLIGLVLVGNSNPTTAAFTERVSSLGSPESDVSAEARLETTRKLLPQAMRQPLGDGLGQAGMAVQLEESGDEKLEEVDNGYLSLLYQSGPLGFLLVVGGLIASFVVATQLLRTSDERTRPVRAALLATLAMLLLALSSADVFFGLPGVILWYLCGLAVSWASRESAVDGGRSGVEA